MKKYIVAFGLFFALSIIPVSSALQRNVRSGATPVDGPTVITRYAAQILPSNYRLGAEQQGYYKHTIHQYSLKSPKFL